MAPSKSDTCQKHNNGEHTPFRKPLSRRQPVTATYGYETKCREMPMTTTSAFARARMDKEALIPPSNRQANRGAIQCISTYLKFITEEVGMHFAALVNCHAGVIRLRCVGETTRVVRLVIRGLKICPPIGYTWSKKRIRLVTRRLTICPPIGYARFKKGGSIVYTRIKKGGARLVTRGIRKALYWSHAD